MLGSSVFLKPRTHTGVTVKLDTSLDENSTLTAVVYADTSGDRDSDEDSSDEAVEDPNGRAVTDRANVIVMTDTATIQEPTATTPSPVERNPSLWTKHHRNGQRATLILVSAA